MSRISTSLLFVIFSLFLTACGGGSKSDSNNDPTMPEVNGSQNIVINLREVSGLPLATKATLSFAGVEVLNTQEQAVSTLELAADKTMANIKTKSLVEAKDLKIMVKAQGFVDMGATVQLKKAEKDYAINILLVPEKTGKVQDGIYTQVINNLTGISSAGTTTETLNLKLEESPETPNLSVTIPKNTKMMDEEGNAVVAKNAVLVRFDHSEENVLDAYPGGLNVQADVGGVMQQVDFKSAGFASIVLKDENGNKVKTFDKDISVAMQFKKGTTDGDGKIVEVDDIVPIWSYDEDKGTWVYEKDGTVKDLNTADNLYDVVYSTNHLTFFNLDWDTDVCDARITVEDNGNVLQNNILKVVLKLKDYNVNKSFIYKGDGFIDLKGLPDSRNWEIQFLDPLTNEVIDTEANTLSICGDRTIAVDLPSTGNLPVTQTEVGVNLYCGNTELRTADVLVFDDQQFLANYGLAINEPFDYRTGDDGVLKVYDLPRIYYDKTLNVNVLATDVDREAVSLALSNTPGPFPIKIGRDSEVNEIKLNLPQSFCDAGGFVDSKIKANLSCATGNIPNTELQTIPLKGLVKAQISGENSADTEVSGFFANGEANLRLLMNTDYNLTVTPFNSAIAQSITNNSGSMIASGDNKTFDFILSDEYCNSEAEDTTYTYENDAGTVIETPNIQTSGSIDVTDYFFPTQSTTLNYRTFSKYGFVPNQPEQVGGESDIYTVNGNKITVTEESVPGRSDFTILEDRIGLINLDADEDGALVEERNTAIGRLYNVGDEVYKLQVSGDSNDTIGDAIFTTSTNINISCNIGDKVSSFSRDGFSYSGEIIILTCDTTGTIKSTSVSASTGTETINAQLNYTELTYFKKGVGEIATIDENCTPSGSAFGNNTPNCTINTYDNRFLVE